MFCYFVLEIDDFGMVLGGFGLFLCVELNIFSFG